MYILYWCSYHNMRSLSYFQSWKFLNEVYFFSHKCHYMSITQYFMSIFEASKKWCNITFVVPSYLWFHHICALTISGLIIFAVSSYLQLHNIWDPITFVVSASHLPSHHICGQHHICGLIIFVVPSYLWTWTYDFSSYLQFLHHIWFLIIFAIPSYLRCHSLGASSHLWLHNIWGFITFAVTSSYLRSRIVFVLIIFVTPPYLRTHHICCHNSWGSIIFAVSPPYLGF